MAELIVQLILGTTMAKTSIHFQPVRGGSEAHNKREKELNYVHKERSSMNEYWQKDSKAARLADIAETVKAKAARELEEARAKKARNLFDDDDVAVIRDSMLELIELQPKASLNQERLAIINVCQEWECNPTFDSVEQLLTNTSNTWTEIVENKDISGD